MFVYEVDLVWTWFVGEGGERRRLCVESFGLEDGWFEVWG